MAAASEPALNVIFANSLDPDQARQNVGPDLDPNCLTLRWYSLKIYLTNNFRKKCTDDKKHAKLPSIQRVKGTYSFLFCISCSHVSRNVILYFTPVLKKIVKYVI